MRNPHPRTGLVLLLLLAAFFGSSAAARGAAMLPDLDQNPPLWSQIEVVTPPGGATEQRLGFGSEVANRGVGPMLLSGSRPSTASEFMTASQKVQNDDGSTTVRRNVGSMRFAFSETHNHWHFIDFEIYELRRPSDFARVARDSKTGYCAGDGYIAAGAPANTPPQKVWDGSCKYGQQSALSVDEGLSVGWIDDYAPQKEGQYVDVTNVPAGQYWLVNRSNPYGRLLESDYSNNAASVLVQLHRPSGGAPYVDVLKSCPATQSCPQTVTDPTAATGAATGIGPNAATIGGSADPNGNDVSYEFEWGATTSYGRHTGFEPLDPSMNAVQVSEDLSGLQPNTTYHYRLVVSTAAGVTRTGADQTFTTPPAPAAPIAETGGSSAVGQSGATVAGRVDPKGSATTWQFEYGTTTGYGSSTASSTTGATFGYQSASRALTGLSPNTTYHYRLVATNALGTTRGLDATFRTDPLAPVATTGSADPVGTNDATLAGTIDPRGGTVSYRFEYATAALGPWTSIGTRTLAATSGTQPVSEHLTGLSPGTQYWFRVVATSSSGSSTGASSTFTTATPDATATTGSPSAITQTGATLGGTVDANGAPAEYRFEYGSAPGSYSGATAWTAAGSSDDPLDVSATLTGLSAATIYHFRLVARNTGGTVNGQDASFSTLPAAPAATTGAASGLTRNGATLGGTVDANGSATEYRFEYGPAAGSYPSATAWTSAGSGDSPIAVSAAVSGLTVNTAYHYRLVARSAGGTQAGADAAFTTLPYAPVATTRTASSITSTSATARGTVNPNGAATTYRFEYGTTSGVYPSATVWKSAGSGTLAVNASAKLSNLTPSRTYYYRLVARNAGGTRKGAQVSFATPAAAVAATTFSLRSLRTAPTGSAHLTVELPAGGTVSAVATVPRTVVRAARLRAKTVAATRIRADSAGRHALALRPRRAARKLLRRRGRLRVAIRVTYERAGARPHTLRRRATLRLRAR